MWSTAGTRRGRRRRGVARGECRRDLLCLLRGRGGRVASGTVGFWGGAVKTGWQRVGIIEVTYLKRRVRAVCLQGWSGKAWRVNSGQFPGRKKSRHVDLDPHCVRIFRSSSRPSVYNTTLIHFSSLLPSSSLRHPQHDRLYSHFPITNHLIPHLDRYPDPRS